MPPWLGLLFIEHSLFFLSLNDPMSFDAINLIFISNVASSVFPQPILISLFKIFELSEIVGIECSVL